MSRPYGYTRCIGYCDWQLKKVYLKCACSTPKRWKRKERIKSKKEIKKELDIYE